MSEILYNGITLPEAWPPKYPDEVIKDRQPVPYLDSPPEVINITLGRQLFVDDFLIEECTLDAVCHSAEKYANNPILYPETPMEKDEVLPFAAPKDGAVLYDRDEHIYKMWYEAGWLHKNAYATSKDGIRWERPNLHIVEGTNEILPERGEMTDENGIPHNFRPDSTTVIKDYDTDDARARYKLFMRNSGGYISGIVATSPDGIHFDRADSTSKQGDRSTIFYNPFRKKWVYSIRGGWGERLREYYECDDLMAGAKWFGKEVRWLAADSSLKPDPYIGLPPQLYNVQCAGYESIMLGLYEVWYGPENNVGFKTGVPKKTELIAMYSRDGFHFTRPTNRALIQASMVEGSWDRGYVQSVGGVCVVLKDELRFYYSGVAGDESRGGTGDPNNCQFDTMYANGACGFATLRRDGFVSREGSGSLLTRRVKFDGNKKYFFINAEVSGSLTVKLCDESGGILAESAPFSGDSTAAMLDFGGFDISRLEGRPHLIKFELSCGKLYSFWYSDTEAGESGAERLNNMAE